jgi:hypothetical protein
MTHVASRDAARKGGRELTGVHVREAHLAIVGSAPFGDLEPACALAVPRGSGRAGGNLAEVHRGRANVVDTVVEFESDSGSSSNGYGVRCGGVGIADEVARRGRRHWAVVDRLANGRGGGLATGDEGGPDV